MVSKKSGSNRDDKPKRSPGRPAAGSDNPRKRSSASERSAGYKGKAGDSSSTGGRHQNSSYSANKTGKPYGDGFAKKSADKPYGKRTGTEKPYGEKSAGGENDRPYGERNAGSVSKPYGDKPARRSSAPYSGRGVSNGAGKAPGSRPYSGRSTGNTTDRPFRRSTDDYNDEGGRSSTGRPQTGDRNYGNRSGQPRDKDNRGYTKSYDRPNRGPRNTDNVQQPAERTMRGKKTSAKKQDDGLIRLNRYISNAGICSRRKADELIEAGVVSVNGEIISELGHKVDPAKDIVRYNGETLKREKMVYVLLNKPKDYITTTDDPQERRTVMHLVDKASRERIYPVGRLDRNTTGLLLMTNDGDLADKLSHPKNNIQKLYMVELNKSLTQGDMNKIGFGLELEDGFIKPDSISYVAGGTKREIGIQIHSGRNRIVRRIFEHLGYEVEKLDRSVYANLTKKDLPRGRWRMLDEKEIIQLKHLV